MKHFKQLLLAVLVALTSSVTANAYDFEVDGIYYNITSSNTCEVTYQGKSFGTYITNYSGSITIPSSVTNNGFNYSVTSIGENACVNCKGLKSLYLPETITKIGNSAFSCSGLMSINIPNSVTEIGGWAFMGCTSLTNPLYNNTLFVKLPESFQGDFQIPDGITHIACEAFYRYSNLNSVVFPSTINEIGSSAFYECTNLKSIELPNSLKVIGGSAFAGCSSLSTLIIGNSVSEIGGGAFRNCAISTIEIPGSVNSIGNNAFNGCSGLKTVVIPQSVISIGEGAFGNCTNLSSVKYYANSQFSGSNSNPIF